MAATGWWFILWLWAPIYGNILSVRVLPAAAGRPSVIRAAATWFGTNNGIFVVSLITIVLAGVLVSIGMAGYARIQKWCFYGGLIGFAVIVVLLLINSHADLRVPRSTTRRSKIFGVNNAYAATQRGGAQGRLRTRPRSGSARSARACCWCR